MLSATGNRTGLSAIRWQVSIRPMISTRRPSPNLPSDHEFYMITRFDAVSGKKEGEEVVAPLLSPHVTLFLTLRLLRSPLIPSFTIHPWKTVETVVRQRKGTTTPFIIYIL